MIISKPKAGWCSFDIGGFHGTPSYIRAVPIDILIGIANFLENGNCIITFDEEGSEFHLVLTEHESFLITVKEVPKFMILGKDPNVVAALLYDDIMSNLDAWLDWLSEDVRDREYYSHWVRRLEKKINECRKK